MTGTRRLWRWKVGTLGGFSLYLDPSPLLWIVLGILPEVTGRSLVLGCVGILIHACAQAAASRALGLGTGSITFTYLGGYLQSTELESLPFQMDPSRRRKYAAMIFAGPLSNILLFAAVTLISSFGPGPEILRDFGRINLYIGLARLIPLYPLDGARLILCWGRSSASRQLVHVPLTVILAVAVVALALAQEKRPGWFGVAALTACYMVGFSLKSNAEIEKGASLSESARGQACPGCGEHLPPVAGPTDALQTASPACWARYVELMKSLEDHDGGPCAELIVDAYAAQHPGTESQSVFRSVDIHLLVLHGVLERGAGPEKAPWIRERAARRGSSYYRLAPPSFRATPKIGSILEAPESERPARIEHYVRGVWKAWATEYRRLLGKWYDQEVVAEL